MARLSAATRRSALVQAAVRVVAREGVHAATTRAIVAEADMSLASFHYAFHSRDELIREVIAFVTADQQRVSQDTLVPGSDIRSALRAGLQAYFELLSAHPEREEAMFELLHYSLRTPELGKLAPLQHARYRAVATELLSSGAAALGTTWSRPIDDIARVLVAMTDGLTIAWLADRDDAAAARLMDAIAETVAALAVPAFALERRS